MNFDQLAQTNVLKLFNAMVLEPAQAITAVDLTLASKFGVITDFALTADQQRAVKDEYKPLNITTLFGRAERDTASLTELITKQVLHYIETYGLNMPGLFDLEVSDGHILAMRFVKGVSVADLGDMVRKLIYANAPIKDVAMVRQVMLDFEVAYDINQVSNNELRIVMFDETTQVFDNGDDAVRYMCYKATQSAMLIKSEKVIKAIEATKFTEKFFEAHAVVLSQVFNRHKRLILAAKSHNTKTAINRITRLSKNNHVPVHEPISKRFVAEALAGRADQSALTKIPVRDKFKILNLLEYKLKGNSVDAFVIRNGKIHIEPNRKIADAGRVGALTAMVVNSLSDDLAGLRNKTILLDKHVDYGLPISRKQTLGNLPFGTEVSVDGGKISSGVYWRDEWGAYDLDLSTIDENGRRTGWGQYSGYSKTNPVTFSGDMVGAHNGAMEFMVSSDQSYGLFVNIFSGEVGAGCELVIGRDGKDRNHWIEDVVVREKHSLASKGSILGFVNGTRFVVYAGRLNENSWSVNNKSSAIVSRGTSEFWTVKKLFDIIGIKYEVDMQPDVSYNHNMKYDGFSYDKLEALLLS